jgi:hypothetical protein
MNPGKIIRILDDQTVVINRGTDHGVEPQMRFGIYTPVDEIVDPDTGLTLGQYRQRKGVIVATEVHPSFSVASTPAVRRQTEVEEQSPLFSMGLSTTKKRRETIITHPSLDVRQDQVDPIPGSGDVAVGDAVEPLGKD